MSNPVHKYDAMLRGSLEQLTHINSSLAGAYHGKVTPSFASGIFTATVSTGLVEADSLIFTQVYGVTSIGGVMAGFTVAVVSISPGGFFNLASVGSVSAGSFQVGWELKRRT